MGPGTGSGQGLELLQLAAHLINGLVELLHPLLQQGINRRGRRGGLESSPGLKISRSGRLARRSQPQRLGQATLAAAIGLAQQPPTQARSPEHGSTKGAQQQAAARAGWALPWISHA
jgi:hypothetical protein